MEKNSTNFHNKKIPKKGSHCICLLVFLIYTVFITGNNYYPQVLLEGCKQDA